MSGHESYPPPPGSQPPPPPGWQQPAPPPSWGQYAPGPAGPPYPAWQPGPGMLGAAHKPGAFPLRPLGLGDMYDGAFKIIRYNPKVAVGAPVLVAAVSLVLPVLLGAVLTWGAGFTVDPEGSDLSTGDVVAIVAIIGSFGLGLVAQVIGGLLVTGMIAHVVLAAAVGRRLGLGEAWAATHGKRWRILGLALLLAVIWIAAAVVLGALGYLVLSAVDGTAATAVLMVVLVVLGIALAVVFYVRLTYLAVATLVLEDVGVVGAIGRAGRLTRGAFWRTFGIALLTVVVAQVAAGLLTCPLSIVGGVITVAVPPEHQLLANLIVQAVTSVVSAALVTPFMTSVSTLQYVDLRMRKEAFDVELLTRAGIIAS